jgi:carbon storage regulator
MLVLSRKQNETIVIDNRITITVVQLKGGGVRLGIDAPHDVTINRGEIARRLARQALAASAY